MKFLAVFALVFYLTVAVNAGGCSGGGDSAAGGGATIPAPVCPKNYILGCQPKFVTIPCSSSCSGGHGGAGAYSNQYHFYTLPEYINGYKPSPDQY